MSSVQPVERRGDSRSSRRFLIPGLRLLVSVSLLALVLRAGSPGTVIDLLRGSLEAWPLLLAAAVIPGAAALLAVARWQVLLRSVDARPGFGLLLRAFLVGAFFNQLLPSTIGGDVVRGWWLRSNLGSTALSLTVVALDRLLGVLSLCLIGLAAVAMKPQLVRDLPQFWLVLLVVVAGAAAFWLLAQTRFSEAGRRLFRLRFLSRLREKAVETHRGLNLLWRAKANLVGALLLSVAMQLCIVGQFVVLARALGVAVSVLELAVLVPIVSVVSWLPIAVNGIGLREVTLATVGAGMGFSVENAVALSLLFVAFTWLYSIVGGVIYMLSRGDSSAPGHADRSVR